MILPKELAKNLSNMSPLVLVKSIGSEIHIVDPLTGEVSIHIPCFPYIVSNMIDTIP